MGEPVLDVAVEAKVHGDRDRLNAALAALANGDPDCRVRIDAESGQAILSGQDELHLQELVWRLEGAGVDVNVGAPQVAYRETITRKIDHEYTHTQQAPGSGQFARIRFRIEPSDGPQFVSVVVAGNVPAEYVLGVQAGVATVMEAGPVIGFPIVGVRFTLMDGAYHDVGSSVLAFEIAGRAGMREAIEKAAPRILEPVMWVEALVPQPIVGDVIGDFNSRRGRIERTEARGGAWAVIALVPLATLFGYVNSLRAMTAGAGRYQLSFSHYAEVPTGLDPDDRFPSAMAMRA